MLLARNAADRQDRRAAKVVCVGAALVLEVHRVSVHPHHLFDPDTTEHFDSKGSDDVFGCIVKVLKKASPKSNLSMATVELLGVWSHPWSNRIPMWRIAAT